MSFSSLSFLYAFLPLTLLCYFLVPSPRGRNGVLLFASLLFYAWGAPRALPLLLGTVLLVWLCAVAMENGKGLGFWAGLLLVLGSLFYYKYLGFFAGIFGLRVHLPALLLPAGISFTSFQLLSYLIDLRRGTIRAERSFPRFLLYMIFFPQLLQGPIVRYGAVRDSLVRRESGADDVILGLRRFLLGLGKKVLLADQLAVVSAAVYGAPALAGTGALWLAALCYTLQIYFDFSGYSDMALGLGRVFGFSLPENFDHPYAALSVTEFWRRWHITLSRWFRDYVYIPLGGNRVSRARHALNLLLVWALTGLWHGAAWNFVLWGLYYGVLLLGEKFVLGERIGRIPKVLRWLLTFALVTLGWVLFNLTDAPRLFAVLRGMFVFRPSDWRGLFARDASVAMKLLAVPLGLWLSFPFPEKWKLQEDGAVSSLIVNGAYCALLVVCILFILSSSFTPFIYFNF